MNDINPFMGAIEYPDELQMPLLFNCDELRALEDRRENVAQETVCPPAHHSGSLALGRTPPPPQPAKEQMFGIFMDPLAFLRGHSSGSFGSI